MRELTPAQIARLHDDSFFPVLWTRAGYRSPFLDDYVRRGAAADGDAEPQ